MRALTVLGLIVVVTTLASWNEGRTSQSSPSPSVSAVAASITPEDRTVILIALQDLLTYAGQDSPVARRGVLPQELLFAAAPARYPTDVDRLVRPSDKQRWEALSPAQIGQVREAAAHLVARLEGPMPSGGYSLQHPRIRVVGEDDASWEGRPIQAYLPGFSKNGNLAFVMLVIPWSIHHADGTYLLGRVDGSWRILLREFVTYP